MKPVSTPVRIAGATLGGALCGGVAVVVGMPALLSVAIGGATYYGLMLALAPPPEPPSPPQPPVPPGAHALFAEAEARIAGLTEATRSLPSSLVEEIFGIIRTAREIMAEIAAQPENIESGRRFLTHYLDSTRHVLDTYGRLRGRKHLHLPPELESKLADVLASVRLSFQQHREGLIADDLVRLNTELDVLQQTVEFEKDSAGPSGKSQPPLPT